MDKLLYCPSYNYKALNCPLRNIDEDNLNKYHNVISNHLFNLNTTHRLHLLKFIMIERSKNMWIQKLRTKVMNQINIGINSILC